MKAHSLVPKILLGILLCLAFTACSPERKKAESLAQAKDYLAAGEYEKAEIEYKNTLQVEPMNPDAIAGIGIIYFDQGRTGLCVPFLTKGKSLQPNNLELRLRLGQLFLSTGNRKDARQEALFLIAQKSPPPESWQLLADSSSNPKENTETRSLVEQQLKTGDTAVLHLALAIVEIRDQKLAEAEQQVQKALTLDPKNAQVIALRSALRAAANDFAQAEKDLANAVSLAPKRSSLRLRYIQFKLDSTDRSQGTQLIKEFTEQVPDYLPAWILRAQVSAADTHYKEAFGYVEKVLARDGINPEALLLKARLHIALNEYPQAVTTLERAQRIFPKFARFHHDLAIAYLTTGETNKAVASLNQALSLAPGYPEATLLLANVLLNKGDSNTAITMLRALVKQQPQSIQPWLMLASAYRAQNSYGEAANVYDQIDKLFPGNPKTPLMKGQILQLQKRLPEARKCFELSLERAPDFMPAVEALVNLDLVERQTAAAERRIQQLQAKYPKLVELFLLQAQVYSAKRDIPNAELALHKAIELQPDSATPYSMLAAIYAANNRLQESLENLNQALSKNPKDTKALIMVGMIQEHLKNPQAAIESYEKLLQLEPRSGLALNNLAYLYNEALNQPDKALKAAQRARELAPNEPHVADTLGWILYRTRQYSWALALLKESAEKLPKSAEVQYHLGLAHYMSGEEEEAQVALNKALQLQADFPGADQARQCLAILAIDPKSLSAAQRALLDSALEKRPDDPVVLVRKAMVHEKEGDLSKAIASCQDALQANPKSTDAMVLLMRLQAAQGDSAKALETGKAARKLAPEDPVVCAELGRVALRMKDHSWAYSLLQEASQKKTDDAELFHDLALAAYASGRPVEAETALRRAVETQASYSRATEAKRKLALLPLIGNTTGALAEASRVEQALKDSPEDGVTLMAAATLREAQGQPAAARQLYERILELYPDLSSARRALVLMLAETGGDPALILKSANKIRPLYPSDPQVAKATGILLHRNGDHARAITLLRESAAKMEKDPSILYYLGLSQLQLKDTASAKEALRKALQLQLRPELAAEANKILASLK